MQMEVRLMLVSDTIRLGENWIIMTSDNFAIAT